MVSSRESHAPGLEAEEFPLTRSQLMMWTGQNLQPSDPLYNMALTFRIRGPLDETAFRAAFGALVANSDALRTTFTSRSGTPWQRVHQTFVYDLPVIELAESDVGPWVREHAEQAFDLAQCLYESVLIRLADDDHVWFFNQHHLTTDAWSASLIFATMSEYYALALNGRLQDAPPLPAFSAYIEFERKQRNSKALGRAESYWAQVLATPMKPSGFFRQTPPTRSGRTLRVACPIGPARSDRIRDAIEHGQFNALTGHMARFQLFATVLIAWLYRVSGNDTITIGTPNHNRSTPGFKKTVGLFIEMFPLRVQIDSDDSFETLYAKVGRQYSELLMNAPSGASSYQHNRAYDVVLNYITAAFGDFNGIPVQSEWIHANCGDRNHLVRMQVEDFDLRDEFGVHFDLNADTFVGQEMEKPGFEFTKLLDELLEDPDTPIARANILGVEERKRAESGFNIAAAGEIPQHTALERFLQQARTNPDAVALACGDDALTFSALRQRMEDCAASLQTAGIQPGDRVAIALPRSMDAVVGILAIMRLGAAYIPVDPTYPKRRIDRMLDDAGVRWLITGSGPATDSANGVAQLNIHGLPKASATLPGVSSLADSGSAYVIFTSGSTGRPKGVEVSHRSLANYIDWAESYYGDGGPMAWPLFSSMSFDLTVTSLFVPLVSGGRIVVYPDVPDTREILIRRVIEDNQVDIVKLTPAHLALLQAMDLSKSRVRKFIVGGENLKSELARSIDSYYGGRVEIYNEYGPTEGTVACTVHRFDPDGDKAHSVPIGLAISNAFVYILNEAGEPQPEGAIGELYIGGEGVADGYVNRPELTAERFVDNPFRPGEKMYRSGDLARRNPDGTLNCLGRADEQFKLNGIRMEPGEIEAAMVTYAGTPECAVKLVQRSAREDEDVGRYCMRCGLTGAHPDAMLDDASICNICRVYENEEDRARSYFRTLDDLAAIVDDARRGAPGKQDCIMLLSGGKDSTYALCQLVELGLTPIVFTLDNGYISDGAKANIRRVVEDLDLELVEGSTPAMNEIFADSLHRFSNVCNGCFKTIYTLSMQLARERGIRHIFTGLSRGQIFETRVADLFRQRIFDPETIDRTIIEARKAYHREHDAVYRCLDTSHLDDDSIFEEIQFVDYYRYTSVSLDTMLEYLSEKVPWVRPADTGRSTNCLINEAGIFVHKKERRYHNYALPYSWDVRLGHKERDAARAELDDDINVDNVQRILGEIGYRPRESGDESEVSSLLVGYYVAGEDLDQEEFRASMLRTLPDEFVPAQFVRIDALPLTPNGKLDRAALPDPDLVRPDLTSRFAAPETEIETSLAGIWADVFGLDRIGIDDGFFELGGDSILNIQIVAAAGKHGIRLSPQQVFDHPTIRELAQVVGTASNVASQQGPVTGDVPLTPIQRHLLDREPEDLERYCQYVILRCTTAPDLLTLQEAVRAVTSHHDALRAHFCKDGNGWRQVLLEPERFEVSVDRVSINAIPDVDQAARPRIAALQEDFSLDRDSLFRVLLLDAVDSGESYLVLLASHLVVDAVSWWILVEDLEQAYTNLSAGRPVRLQAKTTSIRHWSQSLAAFADSGAAMDTLPIWETVSGAGQLVVPPDAGLPGANDQRDMATIDTSADSKLTQMLITDVASFGRLQPQELMLAALGATLSGWLNRDALVVDLESHGREVISPELDLLRTVGWFTSLYPVYLPNAGSGDHGDRLRAAREAVRKIPSGGVAFGALRYLGNSPEVRARLEALPQSPLLFNYLGQWRQRTARDSWLKFERPVMAVSGSSGRRRYVLEVNAAIFDGKLRVAWTYGRKYHHRHTVEKLAERFLEHVRELSLYCVSRKDRDLVPQDFPDAELSDTELEEILSEFGEH